MASDEFCLRWNNHQSTLISVFDTLLGSGTLVDCTLSAGGQYLKAHKVVLSACSSYLEDLLSQHYDKHPIVILKDVSFQELKSMLDYMYRGEVNISQDQLGTFLKAAESLQLKGLSEGGGGDSDARDVGSTKNQRRDPPPSARKSVAAAPTPQTRRTAAHVQPHLTRDISSAISNNAQTLRPREGSVSPSLRKRKRITRSSRGDDSNMLTDAQLENNSCDLPSQVHSTPLKLSGIVPTPNIPVSSTPVVPSTTPSLNEQNLETDELNMAEKSNLNSRLAASGLISEKIEPTSEVLLEPKTEYMEEMNNEDSVEDLTLDDDDDDCGEMDGTSMDNMSSAGPSHTEDGSNQQGFESWQMAADDKLSTDEVFQAALGANRGDSQGRGHAVGFSELVSFPSKFPIGSQFYLSYCSSYGEYCN